MRRFIRSNIYKSKVVRLSSAEAAAPAGKAILQLIRFDPSNNTQRIESYEYDKKQDFMVLDLLTAVKAHQDPTLAFRASCCEGVCGSCAMNINGINSLACITFASQVTTVGPLPNFPVIKDFVVDLRGFFRQYEYIRPFVRNVNLPQCHIDNIYDRYSAACKALLGSNAEEAGEADHPSVEPVRTAAAQLSQLLDASVASGNVGQVVEVLRQFRERGFVINNEAAKRLVLDTVKNA
jgi:hypothetical protein